MKLKSFGCSFIYGNDLTDIVPHTSGVNTFDGFSRLTWPAHLAQNLGYEYECYARPGSGNLQIAERALNQIDQSSSNDLFVIGWSWIDRFDYYPETPTTFNWNPWQTLLPVDSTKLAKTYYKEIHSEYRDKLTTLMNVRLVIDSLKQKNIPFIMTYADNLIFDQQWHISPAVTNLQQYIQPHMTKFDDLTFLEWSRKNGHPESATWHPLESAHASASDYLINHNLIHSA